MICSAVTPVSGERSRGPKPSSCDCAAAWAKSTGVLSRHEAKRQEMKARRNIIYKNRRSGTRESGSRLEIVAGDTLTRICREITVRKIFAGSLFFLPMLVFGQTR